MLALYTPSSQQDVSGAVLRGESVTRHPPRESDPDQSDEYLETTYITIEPHVLSVSESAPVRVKRPGAMYREPRQFRGTGGLRHLESGIADLVPAVHSPRPEPAAAVGYRPPGLPGLASYRHEILYGQPFVHQLLNPNSFLVSSF